MQKRTKSLLEELEIIGNNRDINHVIESRANNIISSAINLLELIKRHYDQDKAELLEKKLLRAMRGRDPKRFSKSLRKKDDKPSEEDN